MAPVTDDWSDWLSQHGPALVLLARQYVGHQADAEDIVHEAFVAFWKARHRVDDAKAYLFASVRNVACNWLRSSKRRDVHERKHVPAESMDWFQEPDERLTQLLHQLHGLPPEQREVLVMKIWGDLTFPQIAEALQVSANTAASRYRYALEKLRSKLSKEPAHEAIT